VVIALNCLSYSLYLVFSKRVVERLGALTLMTWLFFWGAVAFSPIGLPAMVAGARSWDALGWVLVGFMVIVPTIVAYAFNAWALARTTATVVTVYIYLQPVLAAGLQWVQLRQPLGPRALLAAALIFSGVAVVARRRPSARTPSTDSLSDRV
jgi:drug/metabolite transporter (DMT)-like permease